MAVGTILIEAHDPANALSYCEENDIMEYCELPEYGRSRHDEPYRFMAYVDCSNDIICDSCGLETCPACTQIHFTVSVDGERARATCAGCQKQNMWSYLASKHARTIMEGSENNDAVGVLLVEGSNYEDLNTYLQDHRHHCGLPLYGNRDMWPAIVSVYSAGPLTCHTCGMSKTPGSKHHFVVNLDGGNMCTDCLGMSIWDRIAKRHYHHIKETYMSGRPSKEHNTCWTKILLGAKS